MAKRGHRRRRDRPRRRSGGAILAAEQQPPPASRLLVDGDLPSNAYRFRAECAADVAELLRLLGARSKKLMVINAEPFPDEEVELVTDLSLEELRGVMRQVADGHVMVQTVAPPDEYTGERDYDL